MSGLICRRLLAAVPVLFIVTGLTFLLGNAAPGDPLSAYYRPETGMVPSDIEALRESLSLDRPLPLRYLAWLGQVLTLNFGVSAVSRRPVTEMIAERLPDTIVLMGTALVISAVFGIVLGVIAAYRHNTRVDRSISLLALVGVALPGFLVALLALYLFAVVIPIFPTGGTETPGGTSSPLLDRLHHLALPAAVLGIAGAANFLRYTRSAILDVLNQDYVTTARMKGLPARTVRWRHVMRNGLIPAITLFGLLLPSVIVGALFVETVFTWPGVASLMVDATRQRDYPVIMAITLMTACAVILGSLLADVGYSLADPRVRLK
jgi:peptide/nickel transport system permease protein